MASINRNQPCPCGSGRRNKHCCGSLAVPTTTSRGKSITDNDLFALVIAADEEGLRAGEDPKQRAFMTIRRVMQQLRPGGYVLAGIGAPPEIDRIQGIIHNLYRPQDISVGGVHMGAFMFRDVFARLSVPIGFGTFRLDPLEHVDLSNTQKDWLRTRPADYAMLCDQFLDIFDFGYGLMDLGHTRKVGKDCHTFMGLAHFQLQAAAATIAGAYDLRGAVQSALLATELALKGGLAANGVSADTLKLDFGHQHSKMAAALAELEPAFDVRRVARVLGGFPAFVPNRYSADQPGRIETGHIVMGAQYAAAEVMRLLTNRDLRASGGATHPRSYPVV
jgi:hypothetical protein